MRGMGRLAGVAMAALALAAVAAGCKGGSSTPTTPSPGGGGTGGGGGSTTTTTITINSSGVVTPNDITVAIGSRVTVINNHNRQHEINSDPHPDHTECPPINDVGFISAGQTRLTGNLTTARTCRFHDHNEPDNNNLKGIIRIQ